MTATTSWRDYAGQLTAGQVADLAAMENAWGHQDGATEQLIAHAVAHVDGNRTDERFAHIPAPAEAVRVHHWHLDAVDGWTREFEVRTWSLNGIELWIAGRQHASGTVTARLYVQDGRDAEPLDADGARRLSAMLCEAAELVDRLTGDAPPFM